MPTRIHVIYRVVCTVCIQVPLGRVIQFSSVAVLAYESSDFRVVVSGIQVIKFRFFIVDTACIADLLSNPFPVSSVVSPKSV